MIRRTQLLAMTCVGFLAWNETAPVFSQGPGKPSVAIAEVRMVEAKPLLRVVGSVQPLKTSVIGSAVAGRVVAIPAEKVESPRQPIDPENVAPYEVERGDQVAVGTPLAQLRTDTLELERRAAEAELKLAEQQLAELQNGSLPEEIAEAEAVAMGAKSAMDNSASAMRRLKSLAASGAATATDLESATERAAIARYAYEAAMASKKRVKDGPRIEQIEQAAARVELQRLNVELITDRIAKHTIVSPFDGYVSSKYSELGAWINAGDPIAEVIQVDEVEIVAPVPAEQAVEILLREEVRVELPGKILSGRVHRIVPVADARSRTYPVTIRVKNELREGQSPLLMPGMLARVAIPWGQKPVEAATVPKDALVLNNRNTAVYVVDLSGNLPAGVESAAESSAASKVPATGKVRRVSVEVGIALGGDVQVQGDLEAGDYVVVLGNERLPAGAEVQVIEVREPSQETQGAQL